MAPQRSVQLLRRRACRSPCFVRRRRRVRGLPLLPGYYNTLIGGHAIGGGGQNGDDDRFGVGDAQVLMRYGFFKRDRGPGTLQLAVQAGVKFPTGQDAARGAHPPTQS